jgi:hypothetical protein
VSDIEKADLTETRPDIDEEDVTEPRPDIARVDVTGTDIEDVP